VERNRKALGFGLTGPYTDLTDRFVLGLFSRTRAKRRGRRVAVCALGSYGRRELCLGSDVDLMVLYQGRLTEEVREMIRQAVYPLWDAKLEVGYSVLTIPECIRLAMDDFRALTALLDVRFLLGSPAHFELFEDAFHSRLAREKDQLLKDFLERLRKREERYNSELYFVEPDIKEGLGGLRDFHFMAWITRVYFRCRQLEDIADFAEFSHFGVDELRESEDFLLEVRNHLHLLSGRKEDRLLIDYQRQLAPILGYGDDNLAEAPAKLMRDVYRHVNRIRYWSGEFHAKALDMIRPVPPRPIVEPAPAGFEVVKDHLVLKDMDRLETDPTVILTALAEADRRGLSLGSGFIWAARRKIALNGEELAASRQAKASFLGIITHPSNAKVLRLMLEMGLIELFIPEFSSIRNLAEFDSYHVRTVDLHCLRTLEVLTEIAGGRYDRKWPVMSDACGALEQPERLFLAGLLHDIGKGYPGKHPGAGARLIGPILERLGVTGRAQEAVALLVEQHLLLVMVSQRRDLQEEKTAVQVAQALGDEETLRMLYLLSAADSIATGPAARGDWKMMLLNELFFKVRRILKMGRLATPDATRRIGDKKEAVLRSLEPGFGREAVGRLMDQASSRYFLNTPVEVATEHLRLALELGDRPFSWSLEKLYPAPVTRVILCVRDRPGLFSKMVGVFSLNDLKVLAAHIHTLKNGLAFDVYEVTNPLDSLREDERWGKIASEIRMVMKGDAALQERLARQADGPEAPRGSYSRAVRVSNDASDFFTVIEVDCGPRNRLLYELAEAVYELGMDVRFAKWNADAERATGVLYVQTSEGQKVRSESELRKTEERLLSII